MAKILRIEDYGFRVKSERTWGSGYDTYDGYVITTDIGDIKVGVDDNQSCCENWGYLTSLDNPEDFVGAEVLSVKVVDEALKVYEDFSIYEGGVMFVNIETNKGVFQLVVYNEHNGYYSHDAVVIVDGVQTHSEYL